jgi:hypothetical protein
MKKTSSFQLPLFLSLALGLIFLSTTSCEKEPFNPSENVWTSTAQKANVQNIAALYAEEDIEPGFPFEVLRTNCLKRGNTYEVIANDTGAYNFIWIFNDQYISQGTQSPSCLCGGKLTVFATRIADKFTRSQTFRLPSCEFVKQEYTLSTPELGE